MKSRIQVFFFFITKNLPVSYLVIGSLSFLLFVIPWAVIRIPSPIYRILLRHTRVCLEGKEEDENAADKLRQETPFPYMVMLLLLIDIIVHFSVG